VTSNGDIERQVRDTDAPPVEGALESVARVATRDMSELDGLLFRSETHWFLFWTMEVEGRRAVVGLEVRPIEDQDASKDVLPAWAMERYQQLVKSPPKPVPLQFAALRHEMSAREVLRERAGFLAQTDRPEIHDFAISLISSDGTDWSGITAEERRRMENLLDALIYDESVRKNMSPVEQIAARRCISRRTAEGRIARARAMGFLTPAQGRRASGGLSKTALDLLERLRKMDAIQRGEN
jgi:hypothetical protein